MPKIGMLPAGYRAQSVTFGNCLYGGLRGVSGRVSDLQAPARALRPSLFYQASEQLNKGAPSASHDRGNRVEVAAEDGSGRARRA